MPKKAILVVLAIGAVATAAGCGKSGKKAYVPPAGPQIVKFDGPSVVPCGKKGEIKTVGFKYATQNATAVEPEIDGQSPGAQAGYDPSGGTMHFAYICPGPHTMTISATGHGKTVSKSATLEPESSG